MLSRHQPTCMINLLICNKKYNPFGSRCKSRYKKITQLTHGFPEMLAGTEIAQFCPTPSKDKLKPQEIPL